MNEAWKKRIQLEVALDRRADHMIAAFGATEALEKACLMSNRRSLSRALRAFYIDVAMRIPGRAKAGAGWADEQATAAGLDRPLTSAA